MQELEGSDIQSRHWWQELRAIVPAEQGSVLYLQGGQVLLKSYSPAMAVNQMARCLGVDVRALRRYLRARLGRRMVPMPLLPDLTLVPLPVRQGPGPLWAYVVFERTAVYRRFAGDPFRSVIYLDDGAAIPTLLPPGELRRAWREALAAKKERRRHYLFTRPQEWRLNEPWPTLTTLYPTTPPVQPAEKNSSACGRQSERPGKGAY